MRLWLPLLALLFAALPGCERPAADVVLYTSVDEPVATQIIQRFERETGLRVRLVMDTEATRSVGLAERLRAEANRPQADVWWGNEPFYTIGLARDGLLAPFDSPEAADIPGQFRDPEQRWAGNGLRARVLIFNPASYSPPEGGPRIDPPILPQRLEDLLHEQHRGRLVMARPTAGTTGSHVAALYAYWGTERADAFFRGLRDNGMQLVAGNSQAAQQVAAGNYGIGLTDNDDVANVQASRGAAGVGIRMILPDQGEGEMGTLTIPTTVGLVTGRPESEASRRLAAYLMSAEVEAQLIDLGFCAYSVRGGEHAVRSMDVDYGEVAQVLSASVTRATALLEGRQVE